MVLELFPRSANGPSWDRFSPAALRVGGMFSAGSYFAGAIDDLRLYSYAMPGSNVAALAAPPAGPWQGVDVGAPNVEGYAAYAAAGNTWTVAGGGADIWTTADQFHFLNQTASGDRSIVTRVTALPINADATNSTTPNSKAGVMFRATTAADSPFVLLTFDTAAGLQFIFRDTAGAAAAQQGATVAATAAPFWLKLSRTGNVFTAFRATTTAMPLPGDWIAIGTHTTALPATALAGVAVTSHDNGEIARAGFAELQLVAPNTAPTISDVTNQTLTENSATAVLPVTIGDAETGPASLTLTAVSSNPTLVPNAGIALAGSGALRTVKVTPAANQTGTATITLTVGDGELTATDPFNVTVQLSPGGNWRQEKFGTVANTGSAADGADPDGDGLTNLWERAFNLNPLATNPGASPAIGTEGTDLTLTYRKSLTASDLTFQVLWSSDLSAWSIIGVTDTFLSTDGATETRMGRVPMNTASPLFLRLRVTAP